MQLIPYIVKNTKLPEKGVQNTVELLNQDCTIPFISRYRKERTGNLDEVQIGAVVKFKAQFEALEKRKANNHQNTGRTRGFDTENFAKKSTKPMILPH